MVSVPVVVRETLHMVHPPHLCVLVAQDWPSLVITLQALRLSITMAAFLAKYRADMARTTTMGADYVTHDSRSAVQATRDRSGAADTRSSQWHARLGAPHDMQSVPAGAASPTAPVASCGR